MSDLDEKLRDIFINDSKSKGLHDDNWENFVVSPDKIIPQIKQAFADEGYQYVTRAEDSLVTRYHNGELMTGQEWYDRFVKELNTALPSLPIFKFNTKEAKIIKAVKRAAGLLP
jgi:hypothetical protein